MVHNPSFKKDLYFILGVHPTAGIEVIDAAHRALLKLYAPRTDKDSDRMAKAIGEAHQILSNSRDRRLYDDYRKGSPSVVTGLGPYKIKRRVAEGGFGITYEAEHQHIGERSCIKQCKEISPAATEILKQETRALWNLSHYGIPAMRDFLELDDGSNALVTSWIEGPTLEKLVETHGRIDPENVAWMTERLLNTLGYLHYHGVVHGDIKPQNIIVQPESHIVVLVDFGLAMVKPTSKSGSKGYTEVFSPPEQLAGKTMVPGSDLYSLGMTMLYALNGGVEGVQKRHVPAAVPDPMVSFIKQLIVQDVLHRPRNAAKLYEGFPSLRQACFARKQSNMKQFEVAA